MKDILLFDYQEDMKARIEEALCLHRSVMAQMPTGTGKTYLLAAIVKSEERRVHVFGLLPIAVSLYRKSRTRSDGSFLH